MKPVRTDLIMSTFKIPVWPSRALSTLLVALALLWTATSARAQTSGAPPERIAYQGFLTDGSGTALGATTPKNYDVTLKIYTAPTGGACVWAETQTVTVDRGNFSLLLGEGNGGVVVGGVTVPHALASIFATNNASDRYVETVVAGVGAGLATVTIAPRIRLVPTAYSFLSTYANNLANANGSNILSSVNGSLTANSSLTVSGNSIFNSFVGIGEPNPGFPLNFASSVGDKISLYYNGNGGISYGFGVQASLLQIHTSDANANIAFGYGSSAAMTEVMRIKGNGNVGIGTSNPGSTLDVNGSVNSSGNATFGGAQIGNGVSTGFHYDGNLALRSSGGTYFQNSAGANTWMYISSAGNVGIGNSAPTVALDVTGSIKSSGKITSSQWKNTLVVDTGATPAKANGSSYSCSGGQCVITVSVDVKNNSSSNGSQTYMDLVIDGTTVRTWTMTVWQYGGGSYSHIFVTTLTAGAHTFSANLRGGNIITAGENQILVLEFPF